MAMPLSGCNDGFASFGGKDVIARLERDVESHVAFYSLSHEAWIIGDGLGLNSFSTGFESRPIESDSVVLIATLLENYCEADPFDPAPKILKKRSALAFRCGLKHGSHQSLMN